MSKEPAPIVEEKEFYPPPPDIENPEMLSLPEDKKFSVRADRREIDSLSASLALMKVCMTNSVISSCIVAELGLSRSSINTLVLGPNEKLCNRFLKQVSNSEKKLRSDDKPKKVTYFTKPLTLADDFQNLLTAVDDIEGLKLVYDQSSATCPRDIYTIVRKYILTNKLVSGKSIRLDDLLYNSLSDKTVIQRKGGKYYVDNSSKSIWNIVKYFVGESKSK